MFSIRSQEKLKQWGLCGVLGLAAIVATTTLGLSSWYIASIGALYIIAPLPLVFRRVDFSVIGELARLQALRIPMLEKNERFENLLSTNKNLQYLFYAICTMFAAQAGIAYLAYQQTTSLISAGCLFMLPMITQKITSIFNNKVSLMYFIHQYSTIRPLNLQNPREAEFHALVNEVCEELQIPLPSISYIDIFTHVDVNNQKNRDQFMQFKRDVAKFMPGWIQNIQSDQEFMTTVQRRINPNMFATRTVLDRQLFINSAMLQAQPAFTRNELKGVLHHELQHINGNHNLKGIIANGVSWATIILGFSSLRVVGIALGLVSHVVANKISKSHETEADLATVNYNVSRDLISFFTKLDARAQEMKQVDLVHEQPSMYKKALTYIRRISDEHPETSQRIAILEKCEQEQAAQAQPRRGLVV